MDLFHKIRCHRSNSAQKLSPSDQLRFLNRLSRLMELGYPIIDALNTLEMDKAFKSTISRIQQNLRAGDPLDEALRREWFPPLVTAFIYFARESGNLLTSVKKGAQLYEQRMAYQQTFKATSRYPLILLCAFLILLFFIKQFLLPSISDMFQSGNNPIMGGRAILMIDMLVYGMIGLTGLLVFLMVMRWITHRYLTIHQQLQIIRTIPLYRNYVQMQTTFNFATHVSTLLASGLPIKTVFQIMSDQKQLPILAYHSGVMTNKLTKGVQPSKILSELFFINDDLAALFQKSINSDTLAKDLSVYAEFLTEDIHRKITKTIGMIQPAVFIMLAFFIILTYVTLMSPMLDLIKTI